MDSLIKAAESGAKIVETSANALGNVEKTANTANATLETATKVIQDKPTLEDSVRESLLKVIVNPKFSEQIESDIATVFRPILKMQLEKVGKIIAKADEAKTPEEAEAVKTDIEKAMNNGSKVENSNTEEVGTEGSVPEEVGNTEGSVTEGSNTKGSKPVSPKDIEIEGGSKRKNRNKSRKSLKKSASRGRRTTRRHKRTSR
jgi:hypothetical protein